MIIAYPDGSCSKEIIQISKDIDFRLGFTTNFKKNQLPINFLNDNNMTLGRFDFYNYIDKKDLLLRCRIFRSRLLTIMKYGFYIYKNRIELVC